MRRPFVAPRRRLLYAAAVTVSAALQTVSGVRAAAAQSPFQPLDLPTPNQYRSGDGRPGPAYWQQRADYRIEATLDTARNAISGRETITYTNNSPSTLTYVWLQVEQNICGPVSVTNLLNQPPLQFQDAVFDFSCKGFAGGGRMASLTSNGVALRREPYGTMMKVSLAQPLKPHGTVQLDVQWSFDIPEYGAGRMGRDGRLYEIAQWYPRVAVFDDVRGWNTEPYIGAGEFYLEYGSFDVSLTMPAGFIIAATGVVVNEADVLPAVQLERLKRARASNTAVAIIDDAEASAWRGGAAPKTWRFHADSVRDFAFAAGPNLRWDAVNYDGILIQTFYRRSADKWPEGIRIARHAIKYFSEHWLRYPYPQASTIEGPIEGMEYPMLTFVPNNKVREDFQWTLMHEFGHQWYPMVVGSNERLYPWMDEGFNTFIDLAAAADYFKGTPYGDSIQDNPLHQHAAHAIAGEQPLMTNPTQSRDLFWTGYRKPALMMRLLREEVLGAARFDAAFREYTAAWAFKHPTPSDFMRVMEDASGMDLDWFWRGWLFSTAKLDQAVTGISSRGGEVIRIVNAGTMVMPVELKITFTDNTTEIVRLPVEMWNLSATFDYRVTGKRVVRAAEVDPRHALPDINRSNNQLRRGNVVR